MKAALERAHIEHFRFLVSDRLGLHFDDSKLDFLADVLQQRMNATRCESFAKYYNYFCSLASAREEMRVLAEYLTVCETFFFRYADHFRAFAEVVIPDRIRAQEHRRQLRLLSAGCASGEEAYSLAIILRDRLPDLASWGISILGIDVNPAILEKAKRGRYSEYALRETPGDLRAKYFHADGRHWHLDADAKCLVTFEERNLIEDAPSFWHEDAFDIVFCRNVTMYFNRETMHSVIERISRSLAPGGFLFLGHAETLVGISQDFHLRHTHDTFYYQRREQPQTTCEHVFTHASTNSPPPNYVPAMLKPSDTWFDVIQRSSERIRSLTKEKGASTSGRSLGALAPAGNAKVPRTTPVWDRKRAIELLRTERFTEAIEILRSLPTESKADADAQLLLAVLLTNRGDLAEAEAVCRHLLILDELNAGAHYLLALCREHAGDRTAALQHDEAAVYLDSAFAMPHLHIGLIAKRAADMKTARQQLSQASSLLAREDASRILLFGGGFAREALTEFCRAELQACGGNS